MRVFWVPVVVDLEGPRLRFWVVGAVMGVGSSLEADWVALADGCDWVDSDSRVDGID